MNYARWATTPPPKRAPTGQITIPQIIQQLTQHTTQLDHLRREYTRNPTPQTHTQITTTETETRYLAQLLQTAKDLLNES